eukprot:2992973-Prymnesium_polylepis.1
MVRAAAAQPRVLRRANPEPPPSMCGASFAARCSMRPLSSTSPPGAPQVNTGGARDAHGAGSKDRKEMEVRVPPPR